MSKLIKIDKLVFGGAGLGFLNNKPVFVSKSVPGDELKIEIIKDKKDYSEGVIKNIVAPSLKRINPPCPYFYQCGGCDHQNISYPDQLKFKQEIFKEVLNRAHLSYYSSDTSQPKKVSNNTIVEPIIAGSDDFLYYRNSIRFFFIHKENGNIAFGRSDFINPAKLIEIDSCLLQSKTANQVIQELEKYFNGNVANKKTLWQLKIRQGKYTNEFMVEIITTAEELPGKEGIVSILKNITGVKSIYHTVTPAKSLRNLRRYLLFGSLLIHEKIGRYIFQISPESFFQTNSLGIKTLYDTIKKYAEIKMGDSLLDLYCGTGSIGIYLSTFANKVTGVESVPEAIRDANDNAKLNKIHNIEFICSDISKLNNLTIQQFKNQIIILDPPRAGLNNDIIQWLSKLNFKRLIYVSCNPATFARDIKLFENYGLKLIKVQPIDMFPQTHHLEVVGQLYRIN